MRKWEEDFIQVFYKGEVYLIHTEYEFELDKFLDERRTSMKYIARKYGVNLVRDK